MNVIKEKKQLRASKIDSCKNILDSAEKSKRSLNKTEQTEYDKLNEEIDSLKKEIDIEERKLELEGIQLATGYGGRYAITTDGQSIRMIPNHEKLASFASQDSGSDWNLADFVRSNMGIEKRTDSIIGSSATVGLLISAMIIDDVRAKSRLIQAGAVTIPIEGETNICKITGDPTVYEHTEGQTDISESVPVFTPVNLKPQTLAALIPVSFELAQDSRNLDEALRVSISGAFAAKLDTLGIATILADSNIPDSSTAEDCGTWAGVLAAVTSALGHDQDIPKALIASTADYGARAALLASTAGSWLGAPPILQNCLDLPTSKMTTGFAIFGDFESGIAVAMRQDLSLEMLRFGKPTSASHYLIATMRAQIVVLQPKVLYNQVTSGASESSSVSPSPSGE